MNTINEAFAKLKAAKVIKYNADVSRDLNFSQTAISEYLKGYRDIPESFATKFNNFYAKHGVKKVSSFDKSGHRLRM